MSVDVTMFTFYLGSTSGMTLSPSHYALICGADGRAVVSGSVSDQEVHFVVNFGAITYELDSTTNVWL
jgi:hypothetical protein